MGKVFLSIFLILTTLSPIPAMGSPSMSDILFEDCKQLAQAPHNFFHLALSPLDWDQRNWLVGGGIAVTTIALMAIDGKIQDWAQANRTPASENISRLVKPLGEGRITLPLLGGLYIYGLLEKDERARQTALIATESFFVAGFFSELVKFTFQRHRPSSGSPPFSFDGPGLPREHQSFASGHAGVAFAVATVVASKYDSYPLIKNSAFILASLTALSRVHDNDHWASDAFFGSAIGYFAAMGLMRINENNLNKNFQLTVRPQKIKFSISF